MFSISTPTRTLVCITAVLCAGCTSVGGERRPESAGAVEFYTVTAELALARGEARVAALQYAAAAQYQSDPNLLKRAVDVASEALQPSVVTQVSRHWIAVDPHSADAHRAAARAALTLYHIDESAANYRSVLTTSPEGLDAAFALLENELTTDENVFGARAVADKLASLYPDSPAARRLQGLAALRADDPAAAVASLGRAVSAPVLSREALSEEAAAAHHDLLQTLARAKILAGDADSPLAEAKARLDAADTPANRFDYAVLLMTAQRDAEAGEQLEKLSSVAESKPIALRMLGLLEFQQGHLDASQAKFRQLVRTGRFLDDGFYYLGVIADRNGDPEHALKLYSQVQHGDNVLPALLRATTLLHLHGEPSAAEDLLLRLSEDEPQKLPEILNARARMYADGGDLGKASEVLLKGRAEFPDSVELRYAEAAIYEDQGKLDDALKELAELAKERPDDPAALNALGFTLADHAKSLGKARRLIERAHSKAPRNPAILDSMGWVLYRQGHQDQALPYLTAAYADEHSGDIAAHLGEVLWRQGHREEAQRIWTEASIMDADNKLLRSTRQRLQAAN